MNNIDLRGKVCLVTGATSGIGKVAARVFAEMGAEVFLLCRDRAKGERSAAELTAQTGNNKIELIHCDLASLTEVRNAAKAFLDHDRPLHVLLNNAGVVNLTRKVTTDKQEEMFAVNHLAHFLLTNLLLERIKASAPARIVNVASDAHWFCKGINFDDLSFNHRFRVFKVYGHSKLANILFTRELARRINGSGITVNALDPGGIGVSTALGMQNGWRAKIFELIMKPVLQTPEHGARTSIYACTATELEGVTGRYFKDCREIQPKPWARDDGAAKKLWDVSADLTDLAAHYR